MVCKSKDEPENSGCKGQSTMGKIQARSTRTALLRSKVYGRKGKSNVNFTVKGSLP